MRPARPRSADRVSSWLDPIGGRRHRERLRLAAGRGAPIIRTPGHGSPGHGSPGTCPRRPRGAGRCSSGLNLAGRLVESGGARGLVSASRGNHSQSLAFAGSTYGVPVTIVVPEGNSPDKNAATEAYGAELVVHGADFQETLEHATALAAERDLLAVPPFHPWLVEGVATYAAELHESVPDLDVVYVPVGMGSGICANIAVRDLLGRDTEVVGVVAEQAPAYALSFEAGEVVATPAADTFVDGVACRTPDPEAVAAIVGGAARIVRVSEEQAAAATALMYRATHNLAEPAGSLALAALLLEQDRVGGKRGPSTRSRDAQGAPAALAQHHDPRQSCTPGRRDRARAGLAGLVRRRGRARLRRGHVLGWPHGHRCPRRPDRPDRGGTGPQGAARAVLPR